MGKRAGINLTKAEIQKVRPGARILRIWDISTQGLGLQVTPGGVYSWVLSFRVHGRKDMTTLGRWPEMTVDQARKAATVAWTKINNGENPNQIKIDARKAAEEARRAAVTVADLAERFIEEHIGARLVPLKGEKVKIEMILDANGSPIGNKESTAREHIRLIRRMILPALGKAPVKDIGPGEISTFLFKARKKTPTQSNRLRSLLGKMFVRAEVWGLRPGGSNPVRGQDKAPERKKSRNLSDREIAALGSALRMAEASPHLAGFRRKENEIRREDPAALAALRLCILAGLRKSEVIGDPYRGIPALTWADVDLEAGVLRIHHKTEHRTGERRTVYLCATARELLKNLPQMLGNPCVIPGGKAGRSLVNLQFVWERIRKATSMQPHIDINDVTLHDLRRTFASVGTRMGYPELWIGTLLGHSVHTVTQVYARVDGDPLRLAVEAIGGRIAGLLDGSIDLEKEAEERRKAEEGKAKKSS